MRDRTPAAASPTANKYQFELSLQEQKCRPRGGTISGRHPPEQIAKGSRHGQPLALHTAPAPDPEPGEQFSTGPIFIALTDLSNLRAAGIAYPSTIPGWRWLFRHRHERGLQDAFRRIGRRIVVDPQRYKELVRESAGP